VIVLLLGLLAAAPPAQARDDEIDEREPTSKAVATTYKWTACVASRNRRAVETMLRQIPSSSAESQAALRVAKDGEECLGQLAETDGIQLRLPTSRLMRGPLFEALLKLDFDGFKPRHGHRPLALPALASMDKTADLSRASRVSLTLADFAACVVAARPDDSLALLNTPPAAEAEGRAIGALSPAFGPCFASGNQFTINKPLLRGFIAEAAYRRAAPEASQ
jgi:hypothetical protein